MDPVSVSVARGRLSAARRFAPVAARWISSAGVVMAVLLTPWCATGDGIASAARPAHGDTASVAEAALETSYRFPSAREQWRTWAWNALGPSAVGGNLVGASWRQWVTEEPSEWGDGWEGFGKRFGAGSLTTFVGETSLALGSAAMRQDPGYYRSPRSGVGPRAWHAVRMTFLARKPDGTTSFSPAKTLSPFAGPLVTQTTVYPDRYDYVAVLTSGAYGLLITAAWNATREFVVRTPGWGGERPRETSTPPARVRAARPRWDGPGADTLDASSRGAPVESEASRTESGNPLRATSGNR